MSIFGRQVENAYIARKVRTGGENLIPTPSDEGRLRVMNKINNLIEEINNTNMAGRAQNYLRGGAMKSRQKRITNPEGINRNYNYADPRNDLQHISQRATGYDLQDTTYQGPMHLNYDNGMNGGAMMHMSYAGRNAHGGAMKKPRKKRTDKGKPRPQSEWQKLVKAVAKAEGLPYNRALKVASKYRKEGYTSADF